jgi:undecaprenyl-diphosphatase
MGTLEQDVFAFFYGMPDWLLRFAQIVTQAGSAWVLISVFAVMLIVKRNPKPALVVLSTGVMTYFVTAICKIIVARPRPYELLHDVVTREAVVSGMGFPSGHTAMATAVSLSLLPYLPKNWRWLPIPWIALVGWSRMYLGVHAPLDIVGGFALGALVAVLSPPLLNSALDFSRKSSTRR